MKSDSAADLGGGFRRQSKNQTIFLLRRAVVNGLMMGALRKSSDVA
jgi:hypothetical protein